MPHSLRLAFPTDGLSLQGQWSTGFYDCCGEVITPSGEVVGGCSLCCKACFCSCCVVGDNSEYMSNGEGVYCAGQGHGGPACLAYLVAGKHVPECGMPVKRRSDVRRISMMKVRPQLVLCRCAWANGHWLSVRLSPAHAAACGCQEALRAEGRAMQ